MKQLFALILPLVISCSNAPDPLPEWVTHSKSDPAYWLGVGTGVDRESAVNSAQNSIAGQISMQIESNIKNLTVEKNQELVSYTRNIIETRVNMSLPEVEIKNVILHGSTWYAQSELNKKLYYSLLAEKRENARQAAISLILDNESKDINERMKSLHNAFLQITSFLDIPLTANMNGRENVNVYAEIQSLFRKLVVGLDISLMNEIPELTCVLPLEQDVKIRVSSFDTHRPSGIPFTISLSSGSITQSAVVEGERLNLVISQIIPGNESGILTVKMNIEDILKTDDLPSFFNIDKSYSIPIQSRPLKVYLRADEINLGRESNLPHILPILSDHFLTKYRAVKVNSIRESDISISSKSESKKGNSGENEWGIFKAMAECMITVTLTSADQNLYMGTLHHIQGSDFTSHKSAGSKALKNLAIQVVHTLLPEMDDILING